MSNTTPENVVSAVGTDKIIHHPYLVTVGDTVIGPQKEAPSIEPETELHECLIYENGGLEAVAAYLTKNNSTITLTTLDIDYAMQKLAEFKVGTNLQDVSRKVAITFTPVVAEGVTAKTLVFPNCYLQPGLSYTPPMGGDEHTAKLVYKALPDENGKLFTWA